MRAKDGLEGTLKLSIVMPAFNEAATLEASVARVLAVDLGLDVEVVLVDDGSTDGTLDVMRGLEVDSRVRVFAHAVNRGKGAGLRTGFSQVTGDIVTIQDADLEYDPAELATVVGPIIDGKADVVFGSRFAGGECHRVLYFWHYVGNRFLTLLSNMLTNLNLTDMETCYKAFRRDVVERFEIEEDGFGVEPEMTAKVARLGCRIYEVGISYYGRTYAEGKKIGWRDGLRAIFCIVKYNVFRRRVSKDRAP